MRKCNQESFCATHSKTLEQNFEPLELKQNDWFTFNIGLEK